MKDRQYPVAEDIALQRKVWRFERVGWYVLLVVVALTLLGLFSRGPLSSTSATSAQGDLSVEYERFHRSGGANPMVIEVRGQPGQTVTVVLGRALMEGFSVDSIQPQPVNSMGTPQGLALTLPTDKKGQAALYLVWRSNGFGLFKSRIKVVDGGEVALTQFIYP